MVGRRRLLLLLLLLAGGFRMGDSIGDAAAGAAVWSGGLNKVKRKKQCYKVFFLEKCFLF